MEFWDWHGGLYTLEGVCAVDSCWESVTRSCCRWNLMFTIDSNLREGAGLSGGIRHLLKMARADNTCAKQRK